MSTVRVASRRRFTTVDRRAINDNRLSLRARGLLFWLLDKPDGWEVRSRDIAASVKEGRDAVRAALAELETCGYLVRNRMRGERGRWLTETVIYEVPSDIAAGQAEAWKSGAGQPGAGEPGPVMKTDTDDCFPLTPRRKFVCMGCAAAPGAPCRIEEAGLGDYEACPWRDRKAS